MRGFVLVVFGVILGFQVLGGSLWQRLNLNGKV